MTDDRQKEQLNIYTVENQAESIKPRSDRARRRVEASNQTNVKDRKHSHRARRRASTNLHTSNERCQFLLDF